MSLEAQGIRVALGCSEVLHGADLSARAGEVTSIVGPNGSGKTTLLRALTGDVAHRGTVRLNGRDVAAMPPWELAGLRAVLPQATPLAFPFNALEVVRLGLTAGAEAARAALAQVWQPVAGGAARWLFLDEPVASLDIGHQLRVMALLRRYADGGGGVVAVMHDLNLTAMVAGSLALMHEGRLHAQGTVQEVLTDAALSRVYGCDLRVGATPPPGSPFLLPHTASIRPDRIATA